MTCRQVLSVTVLLAAAVWASCAGCALSSVGFSAVSALSEVEGKVHRPLSSGCADPAPGTRPPGCAEPSA